MQRSMMRGLSRGAIAALMVIGLSTSLHAGGFDDDGDGGGGGGGGGGQPEPLLVSIDRATDQLVSIDPTTGVVTTIGALGYDTSDTDLAWHDGRLFAINSVLGSHVDLLEIDVQSGAVTAMSTVARNGTGILSAEGLTSVNGELYIGYNNNEDLGRSNALGRLGADGSISNELDLTSFSPFADLDALGASNGVMFSGDTRPSDGIVRMFNITADPATYAAFGSLSLDQSMTAIHDLEFYDGTLFGIDGGSAMLNAINSDDASLLYSIDLLGGGDLHGLATVMAVTPAPGAMAVFGLAALGGRRRRRN